MRTDSDPGSRPASFATDIAKPLPRPILGVATPIESDPYSAFALAETLDRRRLGRAALVAVAAHGLLLLLQLPPSSRVEAAAEDKRVLYLLDQPRFRPPEVEPERAVPRRRERRMPMPDPTPDAPEPLPPLDDEPILLELDEDVIFDVPESAPELPPPEPQFEDVFIVGGEVQKPVKILAPAPVYTELARRARIQGIVILQAVIDRDGAVISTEVVRGLPMGLNEAALEAVRQWRYEPATLHGRPVAVAFQLVVKFELH